MATVALDVPQERNTRTMGMLFLPSVWNAMWRDFSIAIAVAVFVLYLPGFAFFKSLRLPAPRAVACAPLYSTLMYALLPIAYYKLGITCSPVSILGPTAAVALVACLISWRVGNGTTPDTPKEKKQPTAQWLTLALYVALASVVCFLILIRNLPTPDAFACRFDNQTHLNLVRAFLDSGQWSSLHTNNYLAAANNARPSLGTGSFYPASWHCAVALICSLTGVSVPVGTNALLVAIASLVFPLGEWAFMQALFPCERRTVLLGALAASGFANWPWHFIVMGPLYPNILGMSLQFAALGFVVDALDSKRATKAPLSFVTVCFISLAALALAHPNTLFSAYVFMAFYGATFIDKRIAASPRWQGAASVAVRIAAFVLYASVVIGFWIACYRIPLLAPVINYGSTEQAALSSVLGDLLKLRFSFTRVQIPMCIACLLGIIALAWREDRWRLICPVAFFALAYVSARCGWGPIKYWTAALWYTDRRRLAMNVTLFLMPIAALGLNALFSLSFAPQVDGARTDEAQAPVASAARGAAARTSAARSPEKGRHFAAEAAPSKEAPFSPADAPALRRCPAFVGPLLVASLVVMSCIPSVTIPIRGGITKFTSFGTAYLKVQERYQQTEDHIYGAEEIAFVEKVEEVIPENSLVLNSPADGSLWAYGANGLNTYYRSLSTGGQTEYAVLIREHLNDYATDQDVQNAVAYTGADYLLVLDKGVSYDDGIWLEQYSKQRSSEWNGINAVDDNTPGFEVVLAEGDEMRLYKIDTPA